MWHQMIFLLYFNPQTEAEVAADVAEELTVEMGAEVFLVDFNPQTKAEMAADVEVELIVEIGAELKAEVAADMA